MVLKFLKVLANYEKHALRVSRVIAVLAKSACKHAIFLATRVKKRESIKDSPERGDNQIRTGDQGVADPRLTAWLCRHIIKLCITASDSDGNRTRVTAVKGRCLNRLTTEPIIH